MANRERRVVDAIRHKQIGDHNEEKRHHCQKHDSDAGMRIVAGEGFIALCLAAFRPALTRLNARLSIMFHGHLPWLDEAPAKNPL
jgi:hypothetical protein